MTVLPYYMARRRTTAAGGGGGSGFAYSERRTAATAVTTTLLAVDIGAAAADRVVALVITCGYTTGGSGAVTGVTIGGVTASEAAVTTNVSYRACHLFSAVVPTGETADIVITRNAARPDDTVCDVWYGYTNLPIPLTTAAATGGADINLTDVQARVGGAIIAGGSVSGGTGAGNGQATWTGADGVNERSSAGNEHFATDVLITAETDTDDFALPVTDAAPSVCTAGVWGVSTLTIEQVLATSLCYYDPSDAATCWQDTAGTTPAGDGDPVGRIDDKSGNGHHWTQATAGLRPIRRDDGSGHWYLDYDGTDDQMSVSFGADLAQPNYIAIATRLDAIGTTVIYSGSETAKRNQLYTSTGFRLYAGVTSSGFGSPAIDTTYVISSVYDNAAPKSWINGSAVAVGGTVGTQALSGLLIGNQPTGGAPLNGRVYGFGLWDTGGDFLFERQRIEQWLADKSGAVLT